MSVSEDKKQEYLDLISNILDNADAADEGFQKVNAGASTLCDVNQIVNYNPNMTVVRDNGGRVLGYDYKYTGPAAPNTPALDVNSNNDSGSFGYATGGGGFTRGGGAGRSARYVGGVNLDDDKVENTGLISGFIDAAWGAVSILSKLGKNVAGIAADTIQATGAAFGDAFDDLLTQSTENGANAIRALFGVDSNGNTTMYLDEDTIGAMAITLRDDGYFANSSDEYTPTESTIEHFGPAYDIAYVTGGTVIGPVTLINGQVGYLYTAISGVQNNRPVIHAIFLDSPLQFPYILLPINHNGYYQTLLLFDNANATGSSVRCLGYGWLYTDNLSGSHWTVVNIGFESFDSYTYDNKTVRCGYGYALTGSSFSSLSMSNNISGLSVPAVGWVIYFGSTYSGGSEIDGISDQSGATSPVDAITGADPHVVGQNLYNQYPQVMGEPLLINVMDDSCNQVTNRYFSIPINYSPTNLNVNAPVTGTLQVNPSFNPDISLDPSINIDRLIDQIILQLQGSGAGRDVVQVITDPDDPSEEPGGDVQVLTPTVPNTGTGVTPETALPETAVQGMWHVYNPSSAEVSAFGAWLWSTNVIDQIIRLFQNPLEAVIGLHAIFGEPHVTSSASIVVGNLTSSVSSRVVDKQYSQLDCGSIWLTEYFGNVFDYAPYTSVSLFLPFIGIVDLDVGDVMRAEIGVVYNIDVYTGACIAQVSVTRDGVGGVVYQYPGKCSVEYPISGASYSRMLQGVLGAAVSAIGSGIATGGNPIMGAAAAGTTFISGGEKMPVQRSGSFAGNAGAMGAKKPYLIIRRPQTNMAINFERYDGRGSNYTSMLGQCTGYTKCKEVHLNVPGAYKDELDEITRLLKEGVIFP